MKSFVLFLLTTLCAVTLCNFALRSRLVKVPSGNFVHMDTHEEIDIAAIEPNKYSEHQAYRPLMNNNQWRSPSFFASTSNRLAAVAGDRNEPQLYLVRFRDGAELRHVEAAYKWSGSQADWHLDNRCWVIKMSPALVQSLSEEQKQDMMIEFIHPYLSHYKFHPSVQSHLMKRADLSQVQEQAFVKIPANIPYSDWLNIQRAISEEREYFISKETSLNVVLYEAGSPQLAFLMQQALKADLGVSTSDSVTVQAECYDEAQRKCGSVMVVTIPEGSAVTLEAVTAWFAEHHLTVIVEMRYQPALMNYAAAWITQSAKQNYTSVWNAGLHGEGQLVAVADSGLDYDHCFFWDQTAPNSKVDMTQRKIVAYTTTQSNVQIGDSADSHGTHVVGTIAGKAKYPQDPSFEAAAAQENGIAYEAQVYFTGMSYYGSLKIPTDLSGTFFGDPYNANARIHSNSWACAPSIYYPTACDKYDTQTASVDKFMWNNQDMLVVFAAGNSGYLGSSTIGSPATCKNCLSVGASQTAYSSWQNINFYTDYQNILKELCAISSQACSWTTSTCCAMNIKACCPQQYVDDINGNPSHYTMNNLASFSSRGPAVSDRIKPDIVAPGDQIISAHGDGTLYSYQCDNISPSLSNRAALMAMAGTSMATPVVSGNAALIRQYFQQGYYPTGVNGTGTPMNVSAALVKAMFVASTVALDGLLDYNSQGSWGGFPSAPSMYQGHGRIMLDNVLYLNGTQVQALQVQDNILFTSAGQVQYFTFNPANKSSVAFVLAYSDYYSYSSDDLVNDIDLMVTTPSGAVLYPNGQWGPDRVNNLEKIFVEVSEPGTYTVKLSAYQVTLPQNVSLVMTSFTPYPYSGRGLSSGIIAGIVIGVIVALVVVIVVVVTVSRRNRNAYSTL